jgi:putative ABC transport system permease protein
MRLARLFGRFSVDREVDDELAFHVEMQTRRYMDEGMSRDAARRAALSRFGDLERVRGDCRIIGHDMEARMRRTEYWQELVQDVGYAMRTLGRHPAFTTIAVMTIALGIGANTAVFSVVNGVLLRSLPYADAGAVRVLRPRTSEGSGQAISPPEFADVLDQTRSLSAVSALSRQGANLTGRCGAADCDPERVMSYAVSPNLFQVLGVQARLGRVFAGLEGQERGDPVVVLSQALWSRRYGADSSLVGRTITVNGILRTVIGVMPPEVKFPDSPMHFFTEPAELWIPYAWERQRGTERGNQFLAVIGRVRPGASDAQVRADLGTITARFSAEFPNRYSERIAYRLDPVPLRDEMVGQVKPALFILIGAVGLVLLIACVNVANLLLARGAARRTELAVRTALGAGRGRLGRQMLTESGVLAIAGGALGMLLAWLGVKLLIQLDPGSIPRLEETRVDTSVLLFSLGVSLLTGLLFGLAPTLQSSRANLRDALGDGRRGSTVGPSRGRVRRVLVAVEVAMAVVVLIGAGLLLRSFAALERVNTGFHAADIMSFQLTPPASKYDSVFKVTRFYRTLLERLAETPGMEHVGAVYPLPMGGEGWSGTIHIQGLVVRPGEPEPHAELAVSMPGYFRTLGISLVAGRDFTMQDDADAPLAAIVDESLARRYWPNENALGKGISTYGETGPWYTVVGVVGHVRNAGPADAGEPQLYVPLLQHGQRPLFLVARGRDGILPEAATLRSAVRALDAELPMARVRAMDDIVARALAPQRFNLLLLSIFAATSLLLAAIGLYGVMSYLVAQRVHEIGIRLALGGGPSSVLRLVIGQGLLITVIGLVVGLAAAAALSGVTGRLLFAVRGTDPLTYAIISIVLMSVALIACLVPARRATRVPPIEAMRGL